MSLHFIVLPVPHSFAGLREYTAPCGKVIPHPEAEPLGEFTGTVLPEFNSLRHCKKCYLATEAHQGAGYVYGVIAGEELKSVLSDSYPCGGSANQNSRVRSDQA